MTPAGVVDDYLGMLLSTAAAPETVAVAPVARAAAPAPVAVSVEKPVAAPAPTPAAAPVSTLPPPAMRVAPSKVFVASPARTAPSTPAVTSPAPAQQRRAVDRTARWLRLRCGEQTYAIELLKIREVVLPAPLLALRGAAPCLAGVMNLRGQVVPVVDLGLQLGDAAVAETASTRIIVLDDSGDVLGLRVSAVEDVVLIGDAQIEGTHTSRLAPVGDHRIRGIARLAGAMMLLLDAKRLMAIPLFPQR